jgi:succinate-semialdehyde dehydrogenase/glutarate-semialdehyde dehydrogenase
MLINQSERLALITNKSLLRYAAYWGGVWHEADDGAVIEVTDPFTGGLVGTVPSLVPAQVKSAIGAADGAFHGWARIPSRERGLVLRRLYDLIRIHRDDLARLITMENGKPLKEAYAEVDYGAGFVEVYADLAGHIEGEVISSPVAGRRLTAEREPIGVCAAITPWNFPLAMLTRKVAPALAAGCTIIAKPASQTPLAALALAALCEEAGVPAGVLNVVTGNARMIGDILTRSSVVRKISFTGSTEVGVSLMAASAQTVKRMSLELGGNAPLIIFDDADLDVAIETAMVAKFRNCGQSCIAANRIYVQRGIEPAFLEAFAKRVEVLKVGDGLDANSDIGPLIDRNAVEKVAEHIKDALSLGGQLLAGGASETGLFARPTLIANVSPNALLTREETFGPLAGVIPFSTYDEAILRANDTPFGLASYVCSSDAKTIAAASRDIETGMIGVNTGLISTPYAPFGGVKLSGYGREGSRHGLDEYLNLKYVCQSGV